MRALFEAFERFCRNPALPYKFDVITFLLDFTKSYGIDNNVVNIYIRTQLSNICISESNR